MNWSAQLNDRSYCAPCDPNTFCVARAGETAEIEYSDARLSFAQFFLPVRWFESDLVDAASSRCGNAIELIDPMNASCHAVSGLARKAVRAMRSGGNSARLLIDELLIDLSSALVERHSSAVLSQPARGGLSPAVVRRVIDYLQAHLAEEVQLAELARLANVTAPHFCRAFAKSTGTPPHRYQIAMRLQKATRLLAEPGLSIADVAFAVGYEDPSYFSRLFCYQAGMSPSEWRREFAK
ncbi:helix-turn-helix domain-containing protein [Qipengyuania qiaonensis]|uniref:AraC family transcriptional regulator n=1 Tax=Qipengyuania qiaonensis TaxID=2867240 RepID=A0ABS7J907_9SPHN|nr:AraC family transcriptional regulator [Qipengyuania qiaonensis]MBX7483800.1 AraC family transcriptional regulator [Qipengyuania qiaonensis]